MDRKQAAQVMGMKLSEIVDVAPVPGGHMVTTHDGQVTLVTPDGQFLSYTPAPAVVEEPEPAPPKDSDGGVPDGTAEQVLAWVGEDAERAAAALAVEQERESPRKGLVDKLGKLAG